MEILTAKCSFDNCLSYPEIISSSVEFTKFSCVSHADKLEFGKIARGTKDREIENFISDSHTLIVNLKSLKSKIIDSTEQLILYITEESQKSLKKVDELISKIKININFISTTRKIFKKIEKNLKENLKKSVQKSSLNIDSLRSSISAFYSKDFFSEFRPISDSGDYHELIDLRLLSNKTPLEKKLQLLSRTLAFSKNPLKLIPKTDLLTLIPVETKPILESPSQLLISLEKNLIVTVKADKLIQFWRLDNLLDKAFEVKYNDYKVQDVTVLKNSNFLLVSFELGFGKLDLARQSFSATRFSSSGKLTSTKLFDNEKYLASSTFEGKIKIWATDHLNEIIEHKMHSSYYNGSINCFDISSKDNWVISGGVNGEMCLREIFEEHNEFRTSGHSGGVTSVNFSPNSKYIISGGEDQYIKIWDPRNFGTALFQKKVSSMRIRDISFSIDSSLALTGSTKKVMMWKISTDEKSFKYVKIDRKTSIPKFGEYFEDALCYLKYFKS